MSCEKIEDTPENRLKAKKRTIEAEVQLRLAQEKKKEKDKELDSRLKEFKWALDRYPETFLQHLAPLLKSDLRDFRNLNQLEVILASKQLDNLLKINNELRPYVDFTEERDKKQKEEIKRLQDTDEEHEAQIYGYINELERQEKQNQMLKTKLEQVQKQNRTLMLNHRSVKILCFAFSLVGYLIGLIGLTKLFVVTFESICLFGNLIGLLGCYGILGTASFVQTIGVLNMFIVLATSLFWIKGAKILKQKIYPFSRKKDKTNVTQVRQYLERVYRGKNKDLDSILKKYEGRFSELVDFLESKYKIQF